MARFHTHERGVARDTTPGTVAMTDAPITYKGYEIHATSPDGKTWQRSVVKLRKVTKFCPTPFEALEECRKIVDASQEAETT